MKEESEKIVSIEDAKRNQRIRELDEKLTFALAWNSLIDPVRFGDVEKVAGHILARRVAGGFALTISTEIANQVVVNVVAMPISDWDQFADDLVKTIGTIEFEMGQLRQN